MNQPPSDSRRTSYEFRRKVIQVLVPPQPIQRSQPDYGKAGGKFIEKLGRLRFPGIKFVRLDACWPVGMTTDNSKGIPF
jgi:hypothetical protein